eukprot:NODE_18_length_47517_cov_0.674814.p22 type:complete len:180 gc:universal NODE_18_length_47517_cov_0.674814:5579-5040(-)
MLPIFSNVVQATMLTLNKPVVGEIWTAGTEINIEWLAGNTPVALAPGYPVSVNIDCLYADTKAVYRNIAQYDPSEWARWIYTLPADWASGNYIIQVCNAQVVGDCVLSPVVQIKGASVQNVPPPSANPIPKNTVTPANPSAATPTPPSKNQNDTYVRNAGVQNFYDSTFIMTIFFVLFQ